MRKEHSVAVRLLTPRPSDLLLRFARVILTSRKHGLQETQILRDVNSPEQVDGIRVTPHLGRDSCTLGVIRQGIVPFKLILKRQGHLLNFGMLQEMVARRPFLRYDLEHGGD